MNGTLCASAFYLLTYLLLFSGFFFYKKTEKSEAIITWLVMTAILIEFYLAFMAGVLNLVHIPLHMVSLGIVNLAAGLFFWYRIKKSGERQAYQRVSRQNIEQQSAKHQQSNTQFVDGFFAYDVIFFVLLILAVFAFAHKRYGFPELNWCYKAPDAGAHFREAMEFVDWQSVSRMFFAQLMNGLFIELLSPFCSYDYYYQWYVLSDILQFLLCGAAFYAVVKKWCKDHVAHIVAIAAAFVFLLGYPLNSTMYGFTYLGMGIYTVAAILILTDMFLQDEWKEKWLGIVLLMLGCHVIFQCYALFMPMTYLAIGLAFLAKQKQHGKLFSFDTLKTGVALFAAPIALGLFYTYRDIFVNDNVSVKNAIASEGSIYRNWYTDFLFFVPIALIGFYYLVKKKKNSFLSWMAPLYAAFTAGMFFLYYKTGAVSLYYFLKNYYLLWLLVLALFVYGFSEMGKEGRWVCGTFMLSVAFACLVYVSGIETKLQQKNEKLTPKSQNFIELLAYNKNELTSRETYAQGKMDLIHYVYEDIIEEGKTEKPVQAFLFYEEKYLYEAMTGQRVEEFDYFNSIEQRETYAEDLKSVTDYVIVCYDAESYEAHGDVLDTFEKVYETDAGFVAKVN